MNNVKLDNYMIDILRILVSQRDQYKSAFDRAQEQIMSYVNQCRESKGLNLDFIFDDTTLSFIKTPRGGDGE